MQLIELTNNSINSQNKFKTDNDLNILTEKPVGDQLKLFVHRSRPGAFTILNVIGLIQKLIKIIKEIHSKDVLYLNIRPENIIIQWDYERTTSDEAVLTLTNFSQACIVSEKNHQVKQSTNKYWYQAPQLQDDILKCSSTIDASSLCALLLWLLTNSQPEHDENLLPHQNEDIIVKLNNKIASTVRESSKYLSIYLFVRYVIRLFYF